MQLPLCFYVVVMDFHRLSGSTSEVKEMEFNSHETPLFTPHDALRWVVQSATSDVPMLEEMARMTAPFDQDRRRPLADRFRTSPPQNNEFASWYTSTHVCTAAFSCVDARRESDESLIPVAATKSISESLVGAAPPKIEVTRPHMDASQSQTQGQELLFEKIAISSDISLQSDSLDTTKTQLSMSSKVPTPPSDPHPGKLPRHSTPPG